MGLTAINFNNPKNRPFLFDGGTEITVQALSQIIERGRPIAVYLPNGKVALLIGDGTKNPPQLNYIGDPIMDEGVIATVDIGAIKAGDDLGGVEVLKILKDIVSPFQGIVLNSMILDKGPFEIGATLSGNLQVVLSITNPENLGIGYSGIISSNPVIFPGQTFDPRNPLSIAVNTTTKTVKSTIVITAQVTDSEGTNKTKAANIEWRPVMWYGSSALPEITSFTLLKGLGGKVLTNTRQRDLNFTTGYSHIGIESDIDITSISFVDIDLTSGVELFPVDMTVMPDLVITNDFGITRTVKMFRSTYSFGGATKTRIK